MSISNDFLPQGFWQEKGYQRSALTFGLNTVIQNPIITKKALGPPSTSLWGVALSTNKLYELEDERVHPLQRLDFLI